MSIKLTWYDEEGEEITATFPSTNEVCPTCEGFGTHLNPSIGQHAYSREEFEDSFDEEGREQYFQRGGIYDVRCEECRGNKVTQVVDEGKLSTEQKVLYAQYQESEDRRARYDADDRATYRMESGGFE